MFIAVAKRLNSVGMNMVDPCNLINWYILNTICNNVIFIYQQKWKDAREKRQRRRIYTPRYNFIHKRIWICVFITASIFKSESYLYFSPKSFFKSWVRSRSLQWGDSGNVKPVVTRQMLASLLFLLFYGDELVFTPQTVNYWPVGGMPKSFKKIQTSPTVRPDWFNSETWTSTLKYDHCA